MTMNVWRFPHSARYYLTHPWKWFQQLWRNCRDTYRRARYGWTYVDVWNWDDWFLKNAVPMLRYLADNHCAYPGQGEFDTSEKWEDWLRHMADLLESGDTEWQDAHNEYYKDYMSEPIDFNAPPSELFHKYAARAKELSDAGEANIIEAFAQIGKNFYALWD